MDSVTSQEFLAHTKQDEERFNHIDDLIQGGNQELKDLIAGQAQLLREHQGKVEPYMQAMAGLGLVYKALIVVGSLIGVWFAVKNVFFSQ